MAEKNTKKVMITDTILHFGESLLVNTSSV